MTKKRNTGLTLIEMLIYIALAGIFLVVAYSVINNFFKSRQLAHRIATLQSDSNYIFNQLTQEIHWSDKLDQDRLPSELVLYQIQADLTEEEIYFRIQDDRLWKNDHPISHSRVKVNTFEVTNRAPAEKDKVPCLEIELGLEYLGVTPRIFLENKTTISLRKSKFKTQE